MIQSACIPQRDRTALQLHQPVLREALEHPRHRLPRRADVLGDLLMGHLIYTAEKIIGWCQVNGFPFMGEFDKQAGIIHRSRNGKLRSALHADSMNARFSFSLENFLFHLNEIGNAYYLYTGIKGQVDKRNPAHFVTSSDKWTGFGIVHSITASLSLS